MKTVAQFNGVLETMGSDVVYHREAGSPCPCRTPEGFRDPAWHIANPDEPLCNERGILAVVTEYTVKGSIQPAMTANRRMSQRANDLLGDVQRDDKVAILPCTWGGHTLNLDGWSDAGDEYLTYDGKRYTVVAVDKVPDVDGDPNHHYEAGLRLLSAGRPA